MESVVGRRPVLEAVRAGVAHEVLVAEGARSTAGLRDLLDEAKSAGIPVRRVSSDRVAEVAAGARHQGVAATVKVPRPMTEADLSRRRWEEDAVVLVLDGVTDPHNVGAVGRTAEAAGAAALILRRKREAGLTATALRASAGALLHLPVAEVPNVVRALERLRDRGFWIVGLDVGGESSLFDAQPPLGPLALVVGSEGRGLSRLVRESCDELVAIPLRGRVASLNVSVAAGVALFAYTGKEGGLEQES
jgi:23S rRNA (guanosine2251-2'-O)-methyltransferase